jgi:hypothetical protein
MKSVTPAFDHLTGGSLTFEGLMVFFDFWFNEGVLDSLMLQKSLCAIAPHNCPRYHIAHWHINMSLLAKSSL